MRLQRRVPLFDDGDLDWERFVSKASKGSDKAASMVSMASFALAAGVTGVTGESVIDEAPEAAFIEALTSSIPDRFPFADAQVFLDALFESGYLHVPMVARQAPYAAHHEYDSLWKRQVSVSAYQLVHDAALDCVARWDKGELPRLLAAVEKGSSDYNSQDAVEAILIIAVVSTHMALPSEEIGQDTRS